MNKRVVLLTGSMGRLGSAFCEKYYNDYIIVGCGRNKKSNFAHHFIKADVNTEAEKIVDETLLKFERIDVLINNAATYSIKPLVDIDHKTLSDLFTTNVVSPHWLSILVLRKFWMNKIDKNKKRNRNIINVSSISGLHVYKNQGAYAPSKAALNLLTRYQASEFAAYNIRVNAIAPTGFPSIITTESVADALREMDESTETGLIKVMDSKSPSEKLG